MREQGRTEECESGEESLHRFGGEPPWKGKRKRGKRKTEKRGTPKSDENVPGDREFLDATIYHPLIGEWRGNESGATSGDDWGRGVRGGLATVRVSRSLRFRRFSDSLRRVYDREKLSIGLKGSPGCKLRSFPRKNSLISVDNARKKGERGRGVQGANVFGTFAIHIAIRASRGLGDEMQKCLNLFNFTHKEILIESVALKREFYKR